MEIPAEVRLAHAQLAQANERFLDYVKAHPEYLKRSEFTGIEALQERAGYELQPWPIFLSTEFLGEIHQLNKELCHLIKVIPHRVFGNDVKRFADFYGLEDDHAQLVVATYSTPRWVEETMARADFMLTADGFKCMEYNLGSRIGGWHSTWATGRMLEIPPVRRFIDEHGIVVRRGSSTLRKLAGYLVKRALQRFSTSEVNIVALVEPGALRSGNFFGHVQLIKNLREEVANVEKLLGGKVRCRLLEAVPDQLEERKGLLYLGEDRIHAVLEGAFGFAGMDATRCWFKGAVDLYNGPATPIYCDKRNLAMLSELQDSDLLNAREQEVVRKLMPWSRRVSTQPLHPQAAPPVERQEILDRRRELVLKPANLSSGVDVFLGDYCDDAKWAEVTDRAFADGNWMVQEILESPPYLLQCGDEGAVIHDMVWGVFLFGDREAGAFLRLGPKHSGGPINANAGASIGVMVAVEEGSETPR